MAGITLTGFEPKTLPEIIEETQLKIFDTISPYARFVPDSVFSQLTNIYSEGLSELWEALEATYGAGFLTAEGVNLDLVAVIIGKKRNLATKATISNFRIGFNGGSVITMVAGTRFTNDNSDVIYETIEEIEFYDEGSGLFFDFITVYTEDTGIVTIPATDSIEIILDPITDIVSVSNYSGSSFFNGTDLETDEELRARIQNSASNSVQNLESGIQTAILNLNESLLDSGDATIDGVAVRENDTMYEDDDGRAPKSVEVIVDYDGTDLETEARIAERLALAKAHGIQTVSTTTTSFTNSVEKDGQTIDVTVSRADEVDIYLEVYTSPTLIPSVKTDLKEWIETWGNELQMGEDVIVFGANSLSQRLNDFTGATLTDYVIKIDKSASPSYNDNVEIDYNEVSIWSTGNILIGDL